MLGRSGADGVFCVVIPPGTALISAYHEFYGYAETLVSSGELRLTLQGLGEVRGTVRLEGVPAEGVGVSAGKVSSRTDAAGDYLLTGVPTGEHWVSLGFSGSGTLAGLTIGRRLEVRPGETQQADFDIIKGNAGIQGQFNPPEGAAQALSVRVDILSDEVIYIATAACDKDGGFGFTALPPGSGTVRVITTQGDEPITFESAITTTSGMETRVVLP